MVALRVTIASPASHKENNGNWQTARRWSAFLRDAYEVSVVREWSPPLPAPDLLIALHARRSASSVAAVSAAGRPVVLVLTGTDLYRDIGSDRDAQRSLELADRIVLLQPAGFQRLPPHLHARTRVIFQSAPGLAPHRFPARPRFHDIGMVGHLRAEKDPLTFIHAASLVTAPGARLVHIGGALDPALGEAARAAEGPHYRWLGSISHADARQRLKRCHAMAITSVMEGGANVIIEAVTSGVPVLASDIEGNRGMLGDDYPGYFPVGDAAALARMIDRSIADPAWYAQLRAQCARRAALFSPEAERSAVLALAGELLESVR
ncbi:selenoneine biosynthesis selenosugar synthase SenB [Pseudoduganella sp. GCM10020061]|uniref:selenoneine biosynthesis selenosugar synthase SenB n=1 Tax=Pseudoduganella sp. GCM10020061 TaxID=3317345 RepID=UPI003629A9B3